jgi:hypothetical protein
MVGGNFVEVVAILQRQVIVEPGDSLALAADRAGREIARLAIHEEEIQGHPVRSNKRVRQLDSVLLRHLRRARTTI